MSLAHDFEVVFLSENNPIVALVMAIDKSGQFRVFEIAFYAARDI